MPRSCAALLLLLSSAAFADGLPTGPYIQASGHGEEHVAPDMLRVSLTLEKTSMDAATARADVEARAAKVLALLRKLGVADKDIKAPAVTVEPRYEWRSGPGSDGKQVLVGQHVVRSIMLTLRDISRYGALVDGLFTAGVTRLDGVAPDTSEREKLQQQALADAVADAHAR
ncbi:MAG TPA: SIMPL domain-containing protein, partial [Gammaproteobacteria bacterium]|nr:SIMPL domain-containing protein [Gammaproteobacteria bacterium]